MRNSPLRAHSGRTVAVLTALGASGALDLGPRSTLCLALADEARRLSAAMGAAPVAP